ncbi:hypothetical protein [Thiolapillus sp.]
MRKRIRQSLAMVLILALTLSGLQSAVFADRGGAGSVGKVVQITSAQMNHDCADCDTQDCCATQTCQMTSHCVSFPAVVVTAGLNAHGGKPARLLPRTSPLVPSSLIPTIYRPPWA